MDIETILSAAYETQHFEIHPRICIDEIYNVYYENIFEALNQMLDHLSHEVKGVVSAETIQKCGENHFKELSKQLDKAIDKLETYCNINVLAIPPDIVLPEDKIHVTSPHTKEDEEKLDNEIKELEQEIIKAKMHKSFLKEKLKEQKIVKEELANFKQKLQDLSSVINKVQLTKEDMQLTVAQCTEICDIIKEHQSLKKMIT